MNKGNISSCLNNRRTSAGGYEFQWPLETLLRGGGGGGGGGGGQEGQGGQEGGTSSSSSSSSSSPSSSSPSAIATATATATATAKARASTRLTVAKALAKATATPTAKAPVVDRGLHKRDSLEITKYHNATRNNRYNHNHQANSSSDRNFSWSSKNTIKEDPSAINKMVNSNSKTYVNNNNRVVRQVIPSLLTTLSMSISALSFTSMSSSSSIENKMRGNNRNASLSKQHNMDDGNTKKADNVNVSGKLQRALGLGLGLGTIDGIKKKRKKRKKINTVLTRTKESAHVFPPANANYAQGYGRKFSQEKRVGKPLKSGLKSTPSTVKI